MAHARSPGRGTHWYQNLKHNPIVTLRVGDRNYEGMADLPAESEQEALLTAITSIFTRKYGAGAVRQWYEGTPHYPVKTCLLVY